MDFVIDTSLQTYLWQPGAVSDAELENSLIEGGGPRDPLIVAELPDGKRVLMDGHRRYTVCTEHNLPYEVDVVGLESMEEVRAYMDSIQLARRNLNSNQYSIVRGRIEKRREEKAGKRKKTECVEKVAKDHGVSERTVYRDKKYSEAVEKLDPQIRDEAVEKLSRKGVEKIAELPQEKQAGELRRTLSAPKKRAKSEPKTPRTFQQAFDEAGKHLAKLQNSLADMHAAKPDQALFLTCKRQAKDVGRTLNNWRDA